MFPFSQPEGDAIIYHLLSAVATHEKEDSATAAYRRHLFERSHYSMVTNSVPIDAEYRTLVRNPDPPSGKRGMRLKMTARDVDKKSNSRESTCQKEVFGMCVNDAQDQPPLRLAFMGIIHLSHSRLFPALPHSHI